MDERPLRRGELRWRRLCKNTIPTSLRNGIPPKMGRQRHQMSPGKHKESLKASPWDKLCEARIGPRASNLLVALTARGEEHQNTSIHSPEVRKSGTQPKIPPLKPTEIDTGSQKVWICTFDHSLTGKQLFKQNQEKNPTGCPYCAGSLLIPENNSLQAKNKNRSSGIQQRMRSTPSEVRYGSGDKVRWLCPEGQEYESIIWNRTKYQPVRRPYWQTCIKQIHCS